MSMCGGEEKRTTLTYDILETAVLEQRPQLCLRSQVGSRRAARSTLLQGFSRRRREPSSAFVCVSGSDNAETGHFLLGGLWDSLVWKKQRLSEIHELTEVQRRHLNTCASHA